MKKFNVALYEPEIPQNTGNIARLCACTGANLYLIGKLGFSLSSKYMKRAGLDYWNDVKIEKVDTLEQLQAANPNSNFYYLTTKSKKTIYTVDFKENDFLVFGPETRGLPEDLLFSHKDISITIPMRENERSLNLSNSVAITLYEAIRQNL
ncbi:MAG: tRNA (cytidine(34)-2'-O)-methyltransferase [bacterium]|nr:tRNA (cytidine(34)-2'-O)-methyltransferase [bacterium]